MALSNRDHVGKALDLLAGAFGPYIDRRMSKRSPMGGNWKAAYADVNIEEDPSAQINVLLDNWQAVFRDELRTTGRNLVGEARDWRNKWAHKEPFSQDDAYRSLDTIERLLALIDAPEAAEVGATKSELMRQRLEIEAKQGNTEARCTLHGTLRRSPPMARRDSASQRCRARKVCSGRVCSEP